MTSTETECPAATAVSTASGPTYTTNTLSAYPSCSTEPVMMTTITQSLHLPSAQDPQTLNSATSSKHITVLNKILYDARKSHNYHEIIRLIELLPTVKSDGQPLSKSELKDLLITRAESHYRLKEWKYAIECLEGLEASMITPEEQLRFHRTLALANDGLAAQGQRTHIPRAGDEESKKALEYASKYCDLLIKVSQISRPDFPVEKNDGYYVKAIAEALSYYGSSAAEFSKSIAGRGFQPQEPMLHEHKEIFKSIIIRDKYGNGRYSWDDPNREIEARDIAVLVATVVFSGAVIWILSREGTSGDAVGIEVGFAILYFLISLSFTIWAMVASLLYLLYFLDGIWPYRFVLGGMVTAWVGVRLFFPEMTVGEILQGWASAGADAVVRKVRASMASS